MSLDAFYLLQSWNKSHHHPIQTTRSFASCYPKLPVSDIVRLVSAEIDAAAVEVLCLLASKAETQVYFLASALAFFFSHQHLQN